jgi:hypothetical protein
VRCKSYDGGLLVRGVTGTIRRLVVIEQHEEPDSSCDPHQLLVQEQDENLQHGYHSGSRYAGSYPG